jgi:pseudaminic acid biosynthesis-associated methylase
MTTEQEEFWAGSFGDEYTDRNNNINNDTFFQRILNNLKINSLFEIGCNRGLNLRTIKILYPHIELNGCELNKKAYDLLNSDNICHMLQCKSILDCNAPDNYDLVFTKGVLIHINPDKLQEVYEKMYNISKKYILICEYYSRNVEMIKYRDNDNKLFKRDFCGEIMTKFSSLKLIDYGFTYYRDQNYPQDDITWFLLEK